MTGKAPGLHAERQHGHRGRRLRIGTQGRTRDERNTNREEDILDSLKQGDEKCPFEFNFDPQTFAPGDLVSYRIPERFADMPFVGTLLAVFEDHVEISPNDPTDPDRRMRGTRESR